MAKKKKKLVSGYFDANTGTKITDSHIEENDSGWRIVKNEPTTKQNSNSASKITNSHLQRYNLDGSNKLTNSIGNKLNNMATKKYNSELFKQDLEDTLNKQNKIQNYTSITGQTPKITENTSEKEKFLIKLTNERLQKEAEEKKQQEAYNKLPFNQKLNLARKSMGKSALNATTEIGKGVVDFAEGLLDAGVQFGSSKYNPVMWARTGQTPWSKDQSKLNSYQNIAKEIVEKDASQSFIDNQLGYNKKLSNGKTIQETLDNGTIINSKNFGGKLFRNIGAQLPGYMTGSEAGSLTTMGISSFGSGTEEAYKKGATRGQATGYGLLNSAIEVATEKAFAGVGGVYGSGEIDQAIINGINKNIKNKLGQKLVKFGVSATGEGVEELLGDFAQPLAQKLTYASKEDLSKLYSDQNYLEDFVSGALSAMIMQGTTMPMQNAQQTQMVDAIQTRVTNNNATQIFNEIKQQNKDLMDYEVANIVNTALENKGLETVDFQETTQENEINNQQGNEIDTPQEVKQEVQQEIKEEVQEQPTIPVEKMNEILNDVVKKSDVEFTQEEISELRESMYKQVEKLGAKVEENINFIKSAEQHNFNSNSEEIKSVARMMEARNIKSSFDSTPFINNSEAALWSIDNDGKRSIIFNPNADEKTIFQNVAVHELTHDLLSSENSAEKLDKQDLLTYISKIEDYEEARKDLEDAYARVYDRNSSEFKNLVDEEAIASVLGSKLGNQEFINRLNGQKPNLARRIYNWVADKIDNIGKTAEYKAEKKYWKNVANRFEKAFNMEYNNSSNAASTMYATENNNPYGHTKEFVKLKQNIQADAHEAISPVAAELGAKGKLYGSATDVNGITYDFEIFNDTTYRVTDVNYNNTNVKEVVDDRYTKTDSRYSIQSSTNEQSNNDFNNESNKNRRTSKDNVGISEKEQKQQRNNGHRLSDTKQKENNRELNSSFSNAKINDYEQMQNEIKSQIDKAYKIDEDFGKNMEKQYKEYREKNQLQYEILENTKSRQAQNVNDDFFKEHESDYDGKSGTKTPDGKVTSIKLQKGDNLAKLSYTENADKIWIDELYVKNQNQGFGSEIVNAIKEYAEKNDKDVEAFKELETAKGFWNKTLRNENSSFSYDSEGRKLSKEQQEYFKDSKVRDDEGNLMVMYHGTPNDFTIFDTKKFGGANGTAEGFGIYLTDNIEVADDYLYADKGKVMNLYANITKPATTNELTINKQGVIRAIKELTKKDAQEMVNDGDYDNIQDALKDTWISNYTYTYDRSIEQSYDDVASIILDNSENDFEVLQELMNGSGNNDYKNAESFYNIITDTLGFDGIQTKWDFKDTELKQKNANILIAFKSNQVKNVDNINPTTNDDIRYSKGNNKWDAFVNKNFSSKGKKTTFGELKNKNNNIPISKTFEKEESNKKIETKENNIKQEKNTPKEKNTIEERIPDVIEVRQSPMDKTSLNKLSKNMAKELYLNNSQTTDLKDVIQDFYRKDFNEYSKKDLFNSIKDKFSEHNEKIIADDSLNDIQQQIRNTKIKVPEQIKEGIGDYNNLRQSNFGKTKLGNTGMELDSFYDELASDYPAYFDSELTGEDQLLRIIDVANMDNSYTETYKLDDNYIQDITDYIDESIKDYKNEELRKLADKEIKAKYKEDKKTYAIPKKITHKEVRQQLLDEMKITPFELASGKDIKSLNYQITDPIRVNEKVFGAEMGKLINEATIEKTKHNTAEKTRFLNRERNDIKDLGIKARSKESAAVQKYAEKQYVNKYGEIVPYGDKELMAEFPNTKTQDKIKRAASMLRNKYDKYIDEINDVITALGYDPIPKRKDYMKHFQELGDVFSQTGVPFNLNDMKADELPTDINGLTEFNRPGKNWFASAQKRYGNKTTYDAITGIDTYLEGAANLIYHTADIQRYRALSQLVRDTFGQKKGFENLENLTEKEAIQRIEDIQNNKLSKYAAWLDEQANNLAGKKGAIDRGVERFFGRRAYAGLNTIKKQVGSNMTGFNVRSAMTNFISSTIASAKTNKLAFVKGTISTINNMFKNDGFVNKSDFLTSRFGSDMLSSKTWQKVSNAGQIFMTGSDWFTANQIVRSKYYEGLQKGMTEQQAIDYADDFASRVMGDRSQGMTAEAFNSKTLGLLTQFQLETNNQWQYMIHDSIIDYQRGSKINGGLKAGATILFQLGQIAAFSYLFNELFQKLTGSRAAFDPIDILKKLFGTDDDDDDKPFGERIVEAAKELTDSIPFGNLITEGGRLPISEALPVKKLLWGKDNNGYKKSRIDTLKETIPYYVLPTGYGQIKKTVKGLSMFTNDKEIKGSYTKSGRLRFPVEDTPENKIQAALFGQYASKTAREYVNGGHSTLTENQQKELKVLDIPISDYWEIKSGLSDISNKLKGSNKTTDERKEIYYKYIDSLKIGKDKKKLLKKLQYKSYTESDEDIKDYISSIKAKKTTKKDLLKKMGLDD